MSGTWLETDNEPEPTTPVQSHHRSVNETTAGKRRACKRRIGEFLEKSLSPAKVIDHNLTPIAVGNKDQGQHFLNNANLLKLVKIKPFPPNIPSVEKLGVWIDYKEKLEIMLEQCGNLGQRFLASLLFSNIGPELETVIVARKMLPKVEEKGENFPFLKHLLDQIEGYFREITDGAVNYNTLMNLKQKPGEDANDFHIRLVRQMKLCEIQAGNETVERTQFLLGMRDQELSKLAFIHNISLKDVIASACRGEAMNRAAAAKPLDPWHSEPQTSMTIAALNNYSTNYNRPSTKWSNEKRYENRARENHERKPFTKPCTNCGIKNHRFSVCPAEGKTCIKCGKVGHFKRVCRQKVPMVAVVTQNSPEEVNEDVKVNLFE